MAFLSLSVVAHICLQQDCPHPGLHIEISPLSADFADQEKRLAPSSAPLSEGPVKQASKRHDPMAGTKVLVVKANHYSGYYGVIQCTHDHLKTYDVRPDATGKILQFGEGFLVERLFVIYLIKIFATLLMFGIVPCSHYFILTVPEMFFLATQYKFQVSAQ